MRPYWRCIACILKVFAESWDLAVDDAALMIILFQFHLEIG